MLTVGTDIVCVKRLERWEDFSHDQLTRVFSEQELAYCTKGEGHDFASLDFTCLAARFAAKEAFFKALSAMLVKCDMTQKKFTFLFLCQHVSLEKTTWDVPVLTVDWQAIADKIEQTLPAFEADVSIAHEREHAIAVVILQKVCSNGTL